MSPSNKRTHFHVYVYEWGILLTLVLIADLTSLSWSISPTPWGAPGITHVVFLADAQNPLTFLKARSWP